MDHKASVIQELDSWIENNIAGLSVNDVVKQSGFSHRALQKMFIFYLDMNIRTYLVQKKLELAANDLIYSPEAIKAIALRYGYGSAPTFTNAFTRKYQISPAKFRRANNNLYIHSL